MNNYRPEPELFRMFGFYECKKCQYSWSSAYTWNVVHPYEHYVTWTVYYPQFCRQCKERSFPYRTEFLSNDKPKSQKKRKTHVQELCGRCVQLKTLCTSVCTGNTICKMCKKCQKCKNNPDITNPCKKRCDCK